MVAGVGRLSGMRCAESLQIRSLGHSCAGAAALSHRHFMQPQAADAARLLSVFPPCLPSLGQNTVIALLFSLPLSDISSMDCRAPAPSHPCAPRAGGCRRSFFLLCHMWLSSGEILEVAAYKADDGVQSSIACLTNTSRISGLSLTVLIYEGQQHSGFTCPISEALLF